MYTIDLAIGLDQLSTVCFQSILPLVWLSYLLQAVQRLLLARITSSKLRQFVLLMQRNMDLTFLLYISQLLIYSKFLSMLNGSGRIRFEWDSKPAAMSSISDR